jgi:hypothetical protein
MIKGGEDYDDEFWLCGSFTICRSRYIYCII